VEERRREEMQLKLLVVRKRERRKGFERDGSPNSENFSRTNDGPLRVPVGNTRGLATLCV
jgi:hypothetical protein